MSRSETPASPSSAARRLSDLINGFWAAQVINVAALLEIPERLAQRPQTAVEIAEAAGAHAPSVHRLLRAMQTLGLCTAAGNHAFALTEAGQLLRADAPGSMRGRALFTGDMLWKQFGDLEHVVRTGERTGAVVSGPEGFASLATDPLRLDAFQRAMAEGSVRAAHHAIHAYDFSRFGRVLDLGGGYGAVLAVLLERFPAMTGAVCDLSYLEEGAKRYLARAGVETRASFIAGDFFESVPAGYDAYVMKFIVHDWDDARAQRILTNCRRAAMPLSRVILLEQVVPDRLGVEAAHQAVIRADLTMMTVGGKERTAEEYRVLLTQAGWRLSGITAAADGFSVIEATPA
jgi:orsellinic acid C2-O-methyltransferase